MAQGPVLGPLGSPYLVTLPSGLSKEGSWLSCSGNAVYKYILGLFF
jgi:hypothetical protein